MALTFPADARITSSSLWLDTPGRRQTDNPFTGEIHRIDYHGARWRGLLTVGGFGRKQETERAMGQKMESFLAEWVGTDEPAEIPHGRPNLTGFLLGPTTVTGWAAGKVTLSASLNNHKPGGAIIRLGSRSYMCTGHSSVTYQFEAVPVIDPGSVDVGIGDTILARPEGNVEMMMVADTYGPWTISWVEAI